MTVLASIAVTSLLIGALFGLMITTMRITAAQERNAREDRAADAAIETAINRMRTEPCVPSDPADPGAVPYLGDQVYDQQTGGTGDDVSVDVFCRSTGGFGASSDQVRIVGDGYAGAMQWTTDCASNASAVGCLPWGAAGTSAPSGSAASSVSMVHGGPEALEFSSGVSVRTGAAALRNPTTKRPAIRVGGEYNQGSAGVLSGSGDPCGLLSGDPGADAGLVEDSDALPSCDQQAARDLDRHPTSAAGLVAPAIVPALPSCSGAVVRFTEGTYDSALTAAVNAMTDGSNPACRNKTFHFEPGIYSFDGRLGFGDGGSYYVFGAPSSWSPGAGVQADAALAGRKDARLCSVEQSGASLVLSATSSLVHQAGRVAICPNRPSAGAAHPAVYQVSSVPDALVPAQPPSTVQRFWCDFQSTQTTINPDGSCTRTLTMDLALTGSGTQPLERVAVHLKGTEPTSWANTRVGQRRMQLAVLDPGGGVVCTSAIQSGLPNANLTSRYDLTSGQCATVLASRTAQSLNGHRLQLRPSMRLDNQFLLTWFEQNLTFTGASIVLGQHRATADAAISAPNGQWTNLQGAAASDDQYADAVIGCAALVCEVADPGRSTGEMFVHELSVGSLRTDSMDPYRDAEIDPNITSLQGVIEVTNDRFGVPGWFGQFPFNLLFANTTPDTFRPRLTTSVVLTTPAGARCSTVAGAVNSAQQITFDLLDANQQGPGCGTTISSLSDLEDASLSVRFEMPCVYVNDGDPCLHYPSGDPNLVLQARPPSIDQVSLTLATNTYLGPAAVSRITSAAEDAASASSFNSYGQALMPYTDLDVYWEGGATTAPLVSEGLILHGLGSTMDPSADMGVVCCSPPDSRTVELIATIDGVERLTARVEYTDVDSSSGTPVYRPGHQVDVLRWLACGSAGCASVLAETDENPP